MKVVRTKEYRIPVSEFGEKLGITERVESVMYFGHNKTDKLSGEDEEYVTVEVSEDA